MRLQLDGQVLSDPPHPAIFVRWVRSQPERATMFFLHGSMVHSEYYLPFALALAEHGFSSCLPDLRGHGRSDGPRGHLRHLGQQVGDLLRVVRREIPPGGSWVLGGESYGAVVAAGLYATLPPAWRPRGMVLVSPAFALHVAFRPWERRLIQWTARAFPRLRGLRPARLAGVTAHPDIEQLVRRDPLLCRRYTLSFFAALLEGQTWVKRLPPPEVPTLIFVPETDVVVDHRETWRFGERWPASRIEVVPQGLHALCFDHGETLAQRIGEWYHEVHTLQLGAAYNPYTGTEDSRTERRPHGEA
ncbi:MAG: lysophospholipase [Firmicutes bacterium]|nr:lysophospholipase [Bacillota bacterium]